MIGDGKHAATALLEHIMGAVTPPQLAVSHHPRRLCWASCACWVCVLPRDTACWTESHAHQPRVNLRARRQQTNNLLCMVALLAQGQQVMCLPHTGLLPAGQGLCGRRWQALWFLLAQANTWRPLPDALQDLCRPKGMPCMHLQRQADTYHATTAMGASDPFHCGHAHLSATTSAPAQHYRVHPVAAPS